VAPKKAVTIRLDEEQARDLERTAKRLGRSPSEAAAMLVDEGLRRERFPLIELRETVGGRRDPYIKGRRLPVSIVAYRMWHGETPEEVAADLRAPVDAMRQALAYAEAFRPEIERIFAEEEEFWKQPEKYIPGILVYRPGETSP
jgi:uncharacterized protein (DUF433 family)